MAERNFEAVMVEIFKHEGGYVDHPRDPGGATNMGITHLTLADWRGAPVTKQDVRELTKQEARAIYRARYWHAIKGDDLPAGLDLVAMDGAVNSGPSRGARWLQQALGVTADGVIGPKTRSAAIVSNHPKIISRACALRLDWLRGLHHWGTFGRGWQRRVEDVERVALAMAAPGRFARRAIAGPVSLRGPAALPVRRAGMTVDQPSKRPTNKLMVAAAIGPAAGEVWGAVMAGIYPPLAGPEMSFLVGAVVALIVGYFVRDRANR